MKTITILSGKGGVGKSSITASLAVVLSEKHKIILADCDVDASNLALVFGKKEKDFLEWKDISTNQKAVFDLEKCNSCGKCYNACNFNAIEWKDNKPKLKKMSCEGCGIADVICPVGAIKLEDVNNAKIGHVDTAYGFNVVSSQLNIGEAGSGKLVAEVKDMARKLSDDSDVLLVDSAAGVGCPVIASVSGSDYCVLVVEPTSSSFYDVKKAFEIVKHFGINSGIVINKFDINEKYVNKIEEYAKMEHIDIIGRLPYSKSFVDALVAMEPVIQRSEDIKSIFNNIADNIKERVNF